MARQIIIRRVPLILLCRLEKQTSRMMLARKCWLFGSLGGNSRSRSVLGITCYWCLRLENQGSERHIDSKWCSLWQRSRAVEKIAMIVEDWVVAESLSMLRELLIKLVATTWMLLSGSVWLLTLLLLGKTIRKVRLCSLGVWRSTKSHDLMKLLLLNHCCLESSYFDIPSLWSNLVQC